MLHNMSISKKVNIAIILILIIFSVVLRIKDIRIPLVNDPHHFRQSQTAITIQDYFNNGFSILNYKTPIFGPPWQMPMEFPLYQITVFCFMKLFGFKNIDLGCRVISIIYFYLSAFALLILCKKIFKNKQIYLIIFLYYIFLPYTIFWSRAALPDYASVFFGLMYIFFFLDWIDNSKRKTPLCFFAVIISGIFCCLSKSTSIYPVVVVLGFMIIQSLYEMFKSNNKFDLNLFSKYLAQKKFYIYIFEIICLCIIPVILGFLWLRYSDYIKAQSVYTQFLTSESLKSWYYGTLAQKFSLDVWKLLLYRIQIFFSPKIMIGLWPISIYAILRLKIDKATRTINLSLLIAIVFTLFSLINLYYVHDYYLIAITPYIAILLGFGIYYIAFEIIKKNIILRCIFCILVIIMFIQPFKTAIKPFYTNGKETSIYTKMGEYIKKTTDINEYVIIQDQSYSSAQLYASNRRGFMIYKDNSCEKNILRENNFTTYIKNSVSLVDNNIAESFIIVYELQIDGWEICKLYKNYSDLEKNLDYDKLINVNLKEYSNVNELEVVTDNVYRTTGNDSYIYYELNKFIDPYYCEIEFEEGMENGMRIELLYTYGNDYWSDYGEILFHINKSAENRYFLKFNDDVRKINRIRLGFRDMQDKEIKVKNINIFEKPVAYNNRISVNLKEYSVVNELEVVTDNVYRTTGNDSYIYYELNKFINPDYCEIEFGESMEDDIRVELLYTHGSDYFDNYGEIFFHVNKNAKPRYFLKFDNEIQSINRIRLSFRNIPNKEIKIKSINIFEK